MTLFIHAPNIHRGGGKTLLLALLENLQQPAILQLDARLKHLPKLHPKINIYRVKPNLFSRFIAEFRLKKLCDNEYTVLCFGNLPPLFELKANIFIYLQNRYLLEPIVTWFKISQLGFRLILERLWLHCFIREAKILVQTETMKILVKKYLKRDAKIEGFIPRNRQRKFRVAVDDFTYLYVASEEPHKNHRRLILAWILLSMQNYRPVLRLTLKKAADSNLSKWIAKQAVQHHLNIELSSCEYIGASSLYSQNHVLIFPSLFESFGLPLLEAQELNIPIIASERDYVRDVVNPHQSFDPLSPRSIARAVLRFRGMNRLIAPKSPSEFLQGLQS